MRGGPEPAQEAVRALHPGARPFEGLLGRRGKHDEQSCCVGAILVDEQLRVDAVVLALAHGADATVFDRAAIGLESGACHLTARIVNVLNIVGPEILDAAFVGYMKKEIKTTKQMLKSPYYSHPDDIEQWKKNIEALKFLVKYYGG